MTLIQAVFSRSKTDRGHVLFSDIARETRVPAGEVEHLVMKAFSLGVLKGKIDQIAGVVHVAWVQPRVLDLGQISTLKDMMDEWVEKVKGQVVALEAMEGASEVFVQ
jgi:26S proteasome regulatory subunit N9